MRTSPAIPRRRAVRPAHSRFMVCRAACPMPSRSGCCARTRSRAGGAVGGPTLSSPARARDSRPRASGSPRSSVPRQSADGPCSHWYDVLGRWRAPVARTLERWATSACRAHRACGWARPRTRVSAATPSRTGWLRHRAVLRREHGGPLRPWSRMLRPCCGRSARAVSRARASPTRESRAELRRQRARSGQPTAEGTDVFRTCAALWVRHRPGATPRAAGVIRGPLEAP
jgi:hypothetical protein